MTLPIVKVVKPTDLASTENGKLGPCSLQAVWTHGWGHLSMHPRLAEAYALLTALCEAETGVRLTTSGPNDAYRSLEAQISAFKARMVDTYDPETCTTTTRTWNGKRYWLRKGFAPVATPGTSNHGRGLAVDVAIHAPTQKYPAAGITSNAKAWAWVQENAPSLGLTWEMQSEPWHVRWTSGDTIPQRILDLRAWFEAASKGAAA